MANNFSPVLGILCFKPIPKYCNVEYEGILCISQWSNTGPSGPCPSFSHRVFKRLVLQAYKTTGFFGKDLSVF